MQTLAEDDRHWIEVVDGTGRYPVKRFGPYATKRLADRAHRCFVRQLNVARYSATVVPQREVEGRERAGKGRP